MSFTLDLQARRAHLILHGQTLLDAWQAQAKLIDEGDKLYAEGRKLLVEGHKLYAEGRELYAERHKLYSEGGKLWHDAVAAEGCTMTWDGDACVLSNGERYES